MKTNNSKKQFALLVAEFFYCGRSPFAPGTMGSLGSLIIWIPSVVYAWPLLLKVFLLLFILWIGVWASNYGIQHYKTSDPKQVVIDEVLGQGIPFLIIAPTLIECTAAFLLFRLFDILKPWPIRWIERRFPDKWGIMLDDVMAGFFALIVIWCAQLYMSQ